MIEISTPFKKCGFRRCKKDKDFQKNKLSQVEPFFEKRRFLDHHPISVSAISYIEVRLLL